MEKTNISYFVNYDVNDALSIIDLFKKSHCKQKFPVDFPDGRYDIDGLTGNGEYVENPEFKENSSRRRSFVGRPRIMRAICRGRFTYVTWQKEMYKVKAFMISNPDDSFRFAFKAEELSEEEKCMRQGIRQLKKERIERFKLKKQKLTQQ